MNEHDDPAQLRPELANDVSMTEQDEEYAARPIPPVEQRVRHWHHWRTGGLLTAIAGVILFICGFYSKTKLAMQLGGFLILAGAVVFTAGVIGGWITRQRPLD